MVKTGGYFLQGLSSGLQSGFEIGWNIKEKKKLEKQKKDFEESINKLIMNNPDVFQNSTATPDQISKVNAEALAMGTEIYEHISNYTKAIANNNALEADKENQYMDNFINLINNYGPIDLNNPMFANFIKGDGKKYLEAYNNTVKKNLEALQVQQPEGFNSPDELLKAHPGADWEFNSSLKKYIVKQTKPTEVKVAGISDYNSAATYLSKFVNSPLDVFNKEKASIQNKFGIDVSNITQESLREPEKVSKGIEPETVSTLKSWEDMFNIKSETGPKTEDEYNRALELLTQSGDKYTPKYPSWKEALISEVKLMAQELKGITDKKDYNFKLNIYLQKLEEIKTKYPEVNLSQFPTFEKPKNWFQKLWGK